MSKLCVFIQASVAHLTVTEGDDTAPHFYLRSTLPIACLVKHPIGGVQGCKHNFNIDSSGKIVNDEIP